MANKRIVYDIPVNTWIKVVDGARNAHLLRKEIDVVYYSEVYDSDLDAPINGKIDDTAEKVFGLNEQDAILDDNNITYVWIACELGKSGRITVTL